MRQSKTSHTLEDRLQPWIDQGEYIIGLVVIVMTWAAGWVDLLAFESFNPVIFGRYSLSFFGIFVLYTLGFAFWFWLIRSLSALDMMKRGIGFFQRKPIFLLPVLAVQVLILWSMVAIEWWATFTMLTVNILTIMVVFWVFILLAKPHTDAPFQTWRKVVLSIVGVLVLAEASLQGLAYANALPFDNLTGLTTPYGRIYQSEQGFANGTTNRYGWYAPDFPEANNGQRIILSGDTYLNGIQVAMEDTVGRALETLLKASRETDPLVMEQGQLGYGAEMFLNPLLSSVIWDSLSPDEIVVVFDLANDFKLDTQQSADDLEVDYVRDVTPYVIIDDYDTWHINAHKAIHGHDGFNPIWTLESQSLLWNAILYYTGNSLDPRQALDTANHSDDMPFGDATFLFNPTENEQATNALARAALELSVYNDFMAEKGIEVRLVTLPYFPSSFYDIYEGSDWEMTIDEYDLLNPERILQETAEAYGIPFLSLGQWMQSEDVDTQTIQSFFFDDGVGYLTEAGHGYLADAIFTCFYTEITESNSGCEADR